MRNLGNLWAGLVTCELTSGYVAAPQVVLLDLHPLHTLASATRFSEASWRCTCPPLPTWPPSLSTIPSMHLLSYRSKLVSTDSATTLSQMSDAWLSSGNANARITALNCIASQQCGEG